MTYNIISSGSCGNATVINNEILIDCGVPFSQIHPYYKSLRLVLLTHIHGDHFCASTVYRLHDLRPTLRIACCKWMVDPLIKAGVSKKVIDVLTPMMVYNYGIAKIEAFKLVHDVPNCGYYIHADGESLFYATDAATLEGIRALDFDLYMIECNHHRAEIEAKIKAKHDAGVYSYEVNAARNHLSWEQAFDWLAENAGPRSKFIPMHEHVDKEG